MTKPLEDGDSCAIIIFNKTRALIIWIAVGHTANYAVVMAQMYTDGVSRGIHPFIVQLRDEETHMPLPGQQFVQYYTFLILSL